MALLVTLFLVLVNIFNAITNNSPKADGLNALQVLNLFYNSPARFWVQGKNLFRSRVIKLFITLLPVLRSRAKIYFAVEL